MVDTLTLERLKRYCVYQDRCHNEVRSKLLSLKVYGHDLEEIMAILAEENFLNEERFARSYVRGKYRIKKWGRNKILQNLKLKKISPYCIKKGMTEIDPSEYEANLYNVLTNYIKTRKNKYSAAILRHNSIKYAQSKGYEWSLIEKVTAKLFLQ